MDVLGYGICCRDTPIANVELEIEKMEGGVITRGGSIFPRAKQKKECKDDQVGDGEGLGVPCWLPYMMRWWITATKMGFT